MKYPDLSYRIFPLGDSALTVDFGNLINEPLNEAVIERFYQLQQRPLPGITEVVPAYCSLTVYYDIAWLRKIIPVNYTVFEWLKEKLTTLFLQQPERTNANAQLIKIPVCYDKDMAPDIEELAISNNLRAKDIVALHTGRQYRVYMLGFLPGFAYLGRVDEKIAAPRKPQPRVTPEGSVGIAGLQTGIYPFTSPGGWQIIGRTPVKLFQKENEVPVLFRAGDMVEFYSITKEEFEKIAAGKT
jgi:inhibitor of KinA